VLEVLREWRHRRVHETAPREEVEELGIVVNRRVDETENSTPSVDAMTNS